MPGIPPELALALFDAAEQAVRIAAREGRRIVCKRKRGLTLRPGGGTPLWNELLRQAAPHLKKRGMKSRLARYLGHPRQRMQDCLKAGTASLDAERTLMLLAWVAGRQQGRELDL